MRLVQSSTVFVAAVTGIVAAGTVTPIWQKPFDEWTTKDAQQIMMDSPWAKQMPMPAAGRPAIAVMEPGANGAAPPTASLGNPSNTTAGVNMTVAANAGSAGPAEPTGGHTLPQAQTPSTVAPTAPAPEPHRALAVIWASAIPVRLAVLKLQSGPNTPTQGEIDRVSKPRENYVIAVVGFDPPDRDTDLAALAAHASLGVRGKPAETAETCTYRRIGNADVYFFRFPRSRLPISLDDHQAEFKARFGQAEIRQRFGLRSMEYQGQLAL
jgi:hypothetical protein